MTALKQEPGEMPVDTTGANAEQTLIDQVLQQTPQIPSPRFAIPRNWEEVEALAKRICDAGWCPKSHMTGNAPNQASVELAILQGMELGVAPLLAVQGIAIINGVPAIWGDLMLAVVTASGLLAYKREFLEGKGDDFRAVCEVKRTTRPNTIRREFSVAMAKRAQLSGKAGPWQGYPSRMLAMRARSWALRDEFADVLKGMASMEELRDSGALSRAIEATEAAARAGGTAAAITDSLKGAGSPPTGQPSNEGENLKPDAPASKHEGESGGNSTGSADGDSPPADEAAKPVVPAETGDLLTPAEEDWMDAAQAMIARIDEAASIADLDVLIVSGHVKPDLDRMAAAGAAKQHDAVTGFIAEKRRGLGG